MVHAGGNDSLRQTRCEALNTETKYTVYMYVNMYMYKLILFLST